MHCMTVLGVYREPIFSPGKVREDAAILDATLLELSRLGYEVSTVQAEALDILSMRPSCALIMVQSNRALNIIENWHKSGTRIINSVGSVRNCYRKPLIHLLAKGGFPIPPSQIVPLEEVERKISFGSSTRYWLKRGDVHAIRSDDVVKIASSEELNRALNHFRGQKIEEILVQEHVEGRVIKFYGVGAGDYFSAFLASSGEEVTSRMKQLAAIASRSAEAVGLEIYGGDAILARGGDVVLIDLNDWPSFSLCRQFAAKSIASYITRICQGEFNGISSCVY
ncbi:MAG: hypothetical protein JRG73_01790 [Deltaproteobacteria bacterium]|nr:hypothetical protein [Deltaproteobacteria bacterium]